MWKLSYILLALPCGANMVYDSEMSGCPASCVDLNSEKTCDQPSTEGCRCKDGFVLSDNKCVPKSQCGCKGSDSKYYPVSFSIFYVKLQTVACPLELCVLRSMYPCFYK
jgi:hypothetical protein